MSFKKILLLFVCVLLFQTKLCAEIVTDGTMGQITTLMGPDFMISDQLGQQIGGNLFHSFKDFNLHTGESATFTGSHSVTNILTRVTGSHHSVIDGTLRSDIANANLYLLNPNGILFGNNAHLDISGSFHASTADYLRLGTDGYFYATFPNQSVLTIAPPVAFGFLNNTPAPLVIQGSFLTSQAGKILSFISGNLKIEDGTVYAPGGKINVAAVASQGEVIPTASNLAMQTVDKLGKIQISQSSFTTLKSTEINGKSTDLANLDVSGTEGGQIFIRAGQFWLDKGLIFADTDGDNNPANIDILVDDNMLLANGAKITADNFGNSQGGQIQITSNALIFRGRNTEIADYLSSLSMITSNNKEGAGIGGEIRINTITLDMSPGLIQAATQTIGKAGNISINAQQVISQNGSFISTGTKNAGHAGTINITATDKISLLNVSSISGSSATGSSGDAGNIHLSAPTITLTNGQMNTFSYGNGNAGSITITADNISLDKGAIIASLASQGNGSDINLQARNRLQVLDSFIVTRTESSLAKDAGNIAINTNAFNIDTSQLLANAMVGDGGNINIRTGEFTISGNSRIDISSKYGINGQLLINAIKLTDNFSLLPYAFFKEPKLPCASFTFHDGFSRFMVSSDAKFPGTKMFPPSQYNDVQPSPLVPIFYETFIH